MTLFTRRFFLLFIISFALITNNNFNFQSFSNDINLLEDDSWSRIIKNGERLFYPRFESFNNSLYILGNVAVQLSPNYYFYIAKYNNLGDLQWDVSLDMSDYGDFSYDFDSNGNLIVSIEMNNEKIFIAKINPFGQFIFNFEISLGERSHETSIKIGENNSIYAIGHSYYPLHEIVVLKFDANAHLLINKSISATQYWYPWFALSKSNHIYLTYYDYYYNLYLVCLNSSGDLSWQVDLGVGPICNDLILDTNESIYLSIIDLSTDFTYILKFNSSGYLLKELILETQYTDYGIIYFFDDILLVNNRTELFCYDLNLDNLWNFNLTEYIIPSSFNFIDIAQDSIGNLYILQDNYLRDISLLKINKTGEYISLIIWGGPNKETIREIDIDSENNLYFTCVCEYVDVWRIRREYAVLVKNPVNDDRPPLPLWKLNVNDYILLGFVGISLITSLGALLSLIKKRKFRK